MTPRSGPVLLVTGASSGIGMATALAASHRGDHLVLVARGERSLAAVAEQCRRAGAASVLAVPTDVGDDSAVRSCVQQVVDRHGRLDAVVHAAGVVSYGRTERVPVEVFDAVLRTNLHGSVNVVRHVLPVLREQAHGTIVLVGSVIGHLAVPAMSPYVLSKWGVRALARQLVVENRDLPGVHVCYLAPGGVDTPIYDQAATVDGYAGRPPPPVDRPEKVARAVLRCLEHPRQRRQVGWSNDVVRLGFWALPRVFDRLVGPLFAVAATDRTRHRSPSSGNVLAPREDLDGARGAHGSAVVGLVRNLAVVLRRSASSGR